MSKQALIGIGIFVVIAVIGGVLLTTNKQSATQPDDQVGGAATSSESYAPDLITAAHQYNEDESLHIVAGEVDLPTPCHRLTTDVVVRESSPEQVTINFMASVQDEDQMCAQVITPQRFKVTFEASAEAVIDATFNDQPVELNLQEVGPGENLEEFEVYTKG